MPTFIDCIKAKTQSANGITPKQAEELVAEYEDLVARYTKSLGDASAAERAASDVLRVKENILRKKNDAVVRHALTQKKLYDELTQERADYESYYNALNPVARKAHRKPSIAHNIANRLERTMSLQQSMSRRQMLKLYDFIEANRSKMAGLTQNTRDMPDVIRAVLGEKTQNGAANDFGKQIQEVFQSLNQMYDQAGGVIGRIENYYPQQHNGDLIVKAARDAGKNVDEYFDDWAANLLPKLDRESMTDFDTGLPINDDKLMRLMREDYEAITTNGLSEIQKRAKEGKQTFGFGSDTFQRRSSSRFYHFKDADSFMDYNRVYGFGDENLFDAVINHIDSMTRDIAMMQELGPKPNAMFRNFELMMNGERASATQQNFVSGMFDTLSGRIYERGSLPLWYNMLEGTKDIMRSAYLSLASVSAVTDSGYVRLAAKMNGLSSNNVTKRYAKLMVNGKEREKLMRTLYVSSAVNGKGFAAARYADDSMSRGVTRWMANFTNRANGLQHMTDVGRMSAMAELSGFFADMKRNNTSWKQLPKEFRDMAKTFGISADDFEVIKKADLFDVDDEMTGMFLRPQEIAIAKRTGKTQKELLDLSYKVDTWMSRIGEMAVNEPTLRTRAITSGAFTGGDVRPGTFSRAFWSSAFMFKSFPITVMQNFVLPLMRQSLQDPKGRGSMMAEMAIYTAIFGGLAIQAKDMLKGRDPRPINDWKFANAALLQGGGLGLFGDFIFADQNRFGQSFTETAAGPVFGTFSDFVKMSVGNMQRAIDPEAEAKFTSDLINFARRNTPVIRTPYTSIFVERLLFDSVDKMAGESDFIRDTNRLKSRLKSELNQGFWWAPGDKAPSRGPALENLSQ